jgi:riboflavin transporter FmnP
MGDGAAVAFQELFWVIVAFNLGKTVAVSLLTLLLYKRLSNFFKKWER